MFLRPTRAYDSDFHLSGLLPLLFPLIHRRDGNGNRQKDAVPPPHETMGAEV